MQSDTATVNHHTMIKIELHIGNTITCKGISSDPTREQWMLCQMEDDDIKEVYYKNIKHISAL
jgi:hypothetical protein